MSSADEILAYWTAERIAAARPIEDVLQLSASYCRPVKVAVKLPQEVVEQGVKAVPKADEVTIVPETNLTTFPYQNVGKLLFNLASTITYASAYYIGGENVLTAAHAVVTPQGTASNLLFIPAMINRNDTGRNYGRFPITGNLGVGYIPDPRFDPNNMDAAYDICTVIVKDPGTNGKTIAETLTNPITFTPNHANSSSTMWNTIGYPSTDSDGRMGEITGTYVEQVANTVTKTGATPTGMSGGPWLLTDTLGGNGVQAGNTDKGIISPYFRDPWNFSALDKLKKK